MAKKKKNNSKAPGKMAKLWKFVSTAAGISGFVSGVVKNDIASSTTFKGRDLEGKFQHIADVFLSRTIGYAPFGIAEKARKFKPLGWINTSTLGSGAALGLHWLLGQAPNFPFKGKIRSGLKNGVFPFLLFQGLGAIFDPPAASPAGTGRIVSRVVELERGLN